MDDWRSKPRTGKSQVTPWLQQIQVRIDMGITMKQAYDELMSDGSISLGYRQFVRYVHSLTSRTQATPKKASEKQTAMPDEPTKTPPEPKKPDNPKRPMTPADFRRIREEFDRMDLNALVSGKGLVFDEK